MVAGALAHRRPVSLIGWLRVSIRLVAMALLLLWCVPLHFLCRLLHLHDPWPRMFLGGVGWLVGLDVTVNGQWSRRGVFLLANHVSWLDIPALAGVTGTAFVAHDGIAGVPLLRSLCEMNDTVFVARHDRASVAFQVEQVRTAIGEMGALTIFPEGTTSDGTGLIAFKSSLLSAMEPVPEGIIVQPVLLDYGDEAPDIAWVGEEPGLDNFLRILARGRPVRITLHFLPPLAGDMLANRKAMAAAARQALAAQLDQRVTL